jgi:hypothetical protein
LCECEEESWEERLRLHLEGVNKDRINKGTDPRNLEACGNG